MPSTRGKRANGEGTLGQRKDGRWEGRLSYLDDTGRSRRLTVYGATQKEARTKLRAAQDRVEAGAPPKDASTTVGAYVEHWIGSALAASDRKDSTKELYAMLARKHLAAGTFGSRPLGVRPSEIEALLATKRAEGLSASTVRTIYSVLRTVLDTAVRDGLVARNAAAAVRRPGIERKESKALTSEELAAVFRVLAEDRHAPLWLLLAGTGLRRGEALGLAWSDVDLDAGTVRVRHTLTRLVAGLVLTRPKTDRSRRTVVLPRQCVEALRALRARQVTERLAVGPAWSTDVGGLQCECCGAAGPLVFVTEIGTPLEPRNVLRRFVSLAERAGVTGVGIHTLRHTAATRLLELGEDTRIVSDILGHSSTAITADVYQHVEDRMRVRAASKLEGVLGAALSS